MKNIVIIILGFFFLIKGADVLISGASGIAKKFHIPNVIVGLTIVSIGTSLPELMISITSSISGHSDISIGNILGSCICNILLILGLTSMFHKIPIDKESKNVILPLTVISMFIILIFGNMDLQIGREEGLMLLGLFGIFIIYVITKMLKFKLVNNETTNNKSLLVNIFYLIIGALALKFGGDFVVSGAKYIALNFNIPESFVGLTIVSIGTSLPELVTGIVAGYKGNVSIALGNIIGSNLFNLLLVLGISAIFNPISYSVHFNSSLYLLILITLLILLFDNIGERNFLTKVEGSAMLLLYLEYVLFIIPTTHSL